MTHTLEEYQKHLEKFGPELLLDTAATELPESELSQLKALVQSYERTHARVGGRWQARAMRQDVRVCAECGLELPIDANPRMKRHRHCNSRAYRRAKASTQA